MVMHWTEEFFIKHGESYIKTLESIRGRATRQVEGVVKIFEEQGVPKGGIILDLCCGIGRHSVLLAEKGYEVVGVDISPVFIKRANEIAKEDGVSKGCTFILGDMRELGKAVGDMNFDAVINMFSSLGYYDDTTEHEILRGIHDITKNAGILLIDAPNRDWIVKNFVPVIYGEDGENRVRLVTRTFDLSKSVLVNDWTIYNVEGEDLRYQNSSVVTHRILSLHEQIRFLENAGWRYVDVYGDFELNTFKIDSNQMITVSKRNGF